MSEPRLPPSVPVPDMPRPDAASVRRSPFATEDWWSVWLGLAVSVLSMGVIWGVDLLGWALKAQVWRSPLSAVKPVSAAYASLPVLVSIAATYAFLLGLCAIGARSLGLRVGRFAAAFTAVFWISSACWCWATTPTSPPRRTSFGVSASPGRST